MFRQSNIFFLLICIFLCSCSSKFSFQKRRYNKGFHIAHSKTPTKSEKHENKTLAVKSFSNESKPENKPTEEKEILKSENPPQITHPQIHSIVQNLYASKNYTNTVSSLKPAVKELESLKKQKVSSSSKSKVWTVIKICISVWLSILCLYAIFWFILFLVAGLLGTMIMGAFIMILFIIVIVLLILIIIATWKWALS